VDEWFINTGPLYGKPRQEVTEEEKAKSFRYQIMDVVDQVNWVPSFGHDREMDWLRNMHDWMISKKRYYGLAIPIWVCDDPGCRHFDVIGSYQELKERATAGWDDFDGHSPHRPFVDVVKVACSECGSNASRISDVGNPWLDAGIVAYSTLNYQGDREYWEKWFPADLVSESFPGQFRNWFYSLLAQSTALTGRTPFKNLFSYASLFAEDGREMHKSWGNAIEFNEAADNIGADTMRWLFSTHKPEQNLNFGYGMADETRRRFMIPLWNVYSFLVTYANLDNWQPGGNSDAISGSPNQANKQLDQWILARLDEVILTVTKYLEGYRAEKAAADLESFLDDVSNWYIRRSRRRFWKSETDADKEAAYATLYKVVTELARLLAPFIPFTTEAIYQNLVRGVDEDAPDSIHHLDWPVADADTLDSNLLKKMRLAINVASLGRSARGSAKFKLRQPLSKARVHVGSEREQRDLLDLADVLTEEINVKQIEVVSEVGQLVNYKLLPNNRLLGPKFGARFPVIRDKLDELDPEQAASKLQSGQKLKLEVGGEQIELNEDEVLVQTESRGGLAVASDKGITVAVDTSLTPDLIQEGYARDVVRYINTMRKDAGFALDDRIELFYRSESTLTDALEKYKEYIQQETLAVKIAVGDPPPGAVSKELEIDNLKADLSIIKI
jgi:isoleucyl-tRNA synthetase